MRQSKLTKAVALMLSLVMVTSVFVGNTLSRYVTSVSSTDNARVAVWGINGKEVTMELFKTQYDLDGKKIAAANQNDDGSYDKIIAPGTGGSSAFSIINFMDTAIAPEVAYQVKIELDDTAVDERIKTNSSIQWKLDNNDWGTWEQLVGSLLLLSGDQSGVKVYEPGTFATAFKDNVEHKISWQWVMDGNNTVDTQMGIDALTGDISAKITVRVTAQQVDDLTTNAYLIDGANQVVNLNYVQPITLKSSADFGTFESVVVNGNPLTRDTDYTAVSGSTVITLNESYLSNLAVGTYTIEIVSSENTATTNFYVVSDLEDNMPMLAASDTWYKASVPRSSVKTINIVNEASEDIINNADESWPAAVDYAGDGELDDDVMCYIDGDVLTIAGNGSDKVYMNYDSSFAFSDHNLKDYFSSVEMFLNADLLDTSKVKDMKRVFQYCTMQTVDISNWDTSNVMNMEGMFAGCSSLTELDVSNFDTSSVTTMRNMFHTGGSYSTNTNLKELDVSNWDTSNVTNMSGMFYGRGLVSGTIDVSNWDVSKVTDFNHTFAYSRFSGLDVSKWVTSSAVSMYAMFHYSKNTEFDVSNFDTSNVIAFGQMFEKCYDLIEIIGLENFDTSNGLGFEEMFADCTSLKELDLSSFDTRKAMNGYGFSPQNPSHITMTMNNIFTRMNKLEKITLGSNFSFNGDGTNTLNENIGILPTPKNANIPGADGTWYNTSGEKFVPKDIPDKTADTYMVSKPATLAAKDTWYKGEMTRDLVTEINIVKSYNPTGNEDEVWDASAAQNGTVTCYLNGTVLTIAGDGSDDFFANPDSSYLFSNTSGKTPYFSALTVINGLDILDTSKVTNMGHMFDNCKLLEELDLSSFNTSNVTTINAMFYNCAGLKDLNLSNFDTSKVTAMVQLFWGCGSLKELDISSFNTSNVTSMLQMFFRCSGLTEIDLSNLDTSNVTSMGHMFGDCKSLKQLDLSNFNTSKVTTMSNMFLNCINLEKIFVSNSFVVDKVTSSASMFASCSKLVGGNGTVWNSNNITSTYAVIDKEGTPGYFTAK